MTSPGKRADRLTQVQAQVNYHRQRLVLHQRLHGSRPSMRLAELEHAYNDAAARFALAASMTVANETRDASRGN